MMTSASIPSFEEDLLVAVSDAALLYQSALGILQVTSLRYARNSLYPLTGTFTNPGPYGGFIAMTMAIALGYLLMNRSRKRSIVWNTSLAAFAAGILVLPASLSRTAWLAFGTGILPLLLRETKLATWIKAHRYRSVLLALAITGLLTGMFFIKKESAVGRFHIWHMECLAIAQKPLTGYGAGMELGAYGKAQEQYFRSGERSIAEKVAAGCSEYPFNEFLGIGMQGGLPALFAALAVCALTLLGLKRKGSALTYGMAALCIFSLASYPLSFPLFRAALLVYILYAIPLRAGALAGLALAMTLDLSSRTPQEEYRSLYTMGYALFQQGDFERALPYMEEGSRIAADPMFLVIQGRCHEGLQDPSSAEEAYRRAIYRVPSRLYPRLLLARLLIRQKRDFEALLLLDDAISIPVNPRNPNMVHLRQDCVHLADSLQRECATPKNVTAP